ncbi:MAG TPA: ABC transporter ATP-binding protein [Spirochaetia bacterium]|nr:ABC transporter ATP-binding protein [Spirochaetia bacterium]
MSNKSGVHRFASVRRVDALLRITRMIFRHRLRMAVSIAAALVAAGFQLAIPRFLGDAVDNANHLLSSGVVGPAAERVLFTTAGLLLMASVVRGLFTAVYNYSSEAVGQILGYELRIAYYEKLQHLSFRYHDRIHSGDLMTLGMLDVEGVRLFVNTGIIRTIFLAVLIGAGAYLLLSTNLLLGLLSLSFVPFVGWRAIVTRLYLRESWLRLQERLSVLTRVMDENLSGIRVVRAFAAQSHEMDKFDRASERAFRLTRHRIGISVRNSSAMTFAYFVSMLLVLAFGGFQAVAGRITVGELTEFLAYMTILQMPVRQLGLMVNSYARASTCGQRLFSVLDIEPDIFDKPGASELVVTKGVLRFEHVSFAFGKEGPEVLSDITFEAGPGTTIGIVGPPGAGKSTIAHLVPRFYDVASGRITIDGQDIRDVTLESLRRAVSVVQQDNFLFTASIDNNVTYGDPWSDRDRIESAAANAQLDAYIRGLADGYGTLVGERGVSLSGGQRQRLAIARGLLLRPPIMIFDDSTAAVDAATERKILGALELISGRRVVIIISHRLTTLMHADEILFIENGQIVERGSHGELLEQGGRYRALYELQSTSDEQWDREIEEQAR